MNPNKPKKRRGAPPPTGLEDRKNSGALCTATRRDGAGCTNFAINGARVCRMHGGAAPQVRAAAQVRILMASDLAAKKLIELMSSPKVDDRVKLAAAKDLLDRANLAGTQNVEIGITKRTFEDFVGEAIVDLDAENSNIIDAEVVEDSALVEEEDQEARYRREDERSERAAELARMTDRTRSAGPPLDSPERRARLAAEAEALAQVEHDRPRRAEPHRRRYAGTDGGEYADRPESGMTRDQILRHRLQADEPGGSPRTMSPARWAARNRGRAPGTRG